jgi:hypothetical protein
VDTDERQTGGHWERFCVGSAVFVFLVSFVVLSVVVFVCCFFFSEHENISITIQCKHTADEKLTGMPPFYSRNRNRLFSYIKNQNNNYLTINLQLYTLHTLQTKC